MTVAVTASGSTREIPHSRPEPEHLSAAPPGPPRASSSVTQPPAATASTKQPARRRPRAGGSVSQHSVKLMPGYVAKSAACTDTRGCTRGCTRRAPVPYQMRPRFDRTHAESVASSSIRHGTPHAARIPYSVLRTGAL